MYARKRILITGGAGFIGSSLALSIKQNKINHHVVVFDNLKRLGSERNVSRLKAHGIEFIHGDIRNPEDFHAIKKKCHWILDCSAEPSVLSGIDSPPAYVLNTNLFGTVQILEQARSWGASLIFLSTSRVYPVEKLNALKIVDKKTRYDFDKKQKIEGFSSRGIAENFSLEGARTLYGTSKLCSELILEEYRESFSVQTIVNRLGVIAGPWQMGKVDQGFVALWVLNHVFQKPLSYLGFEGSGKQVRDVLHVQDLCDLILYQMDHPSDFKEKVWNVGGGALLSTSLQELTRLVREVTSQSIPIHPEIKGRKGDIGVYYTDCSRVMKRCSWRPKKTLEQIVCDIHQWIMENKPLLEAQYVS